MLARFTSARKLKWIVKEEQEEEGKEGGGGKGEGKKSPERF